MDETLSWTRTPDRCLIRQNSPSSSARTARRPKTAASTRRRSTAITPPSRRCLIAFLQGRSGDVLEIGGGTGQHAVAFARQLPAITWWPTDFNDNHLRSIAAWRAACQARQRAARRSASTPALPDWRLADARPALAIHRDILRQRHPHLAMGGGAKACSPAPAAISTADGRLFLYGPFKRDGQHNAPSNAAFDESLRAPRSAVGRARHRRPEKTRRGERASPCRVDRNARRTTPF